MLQYRRITKNQESEAKEMIINGVRDEPAEWKKLPIPVHALFVPIVCQVASINILWDELQTALDTTSNGELSNFDVAKKTAPGFFHIFHHAAHDSLVMYLCRLADRPKMGRFDNVSIKHLIEEVGENSVNGDAEIKSALTNLLESCSESLNILDNLRDKRLAHNDRETLQLPPATLPRLQIENVNHVLEVYKNILLEVLRYYKATDPTDPNEISELNSRMEAGASILMVKLRLFLEDQEGA